MRKHLQIALMASTVAATSLSLMPQLRAAEDGNGASQKNTATQISATDERGRKIYVNEAVPASAAQHAQTSETPRRRLMYWSSKENRWKPVPPPNAAFRPRRQRTLIAPSRRLRHGITWTRTWCAPW
jgi:hypothetical protein